MIEAIGCKAYFLDLPLPSGDNAYATVLPAV
jgi:hypothetical protein